MELIPSSPQNEWPQPHQNNQIHDQKGGSLNTTNNNTNTNTTNNNNIKMGSVGDQQKQQQNHHEPLRCPRCDSSNTKFCYYNNYSLSQPRHFCKACKRYWTRGGTLRSVPVGGGCRKNKRVKRPSNHSSSSSSSSALTNTNLEASNSATSGQSIHLNPLFFGMPTTDSNINFPFSRYDLQTPSQIQGLGLGFSSSSSSGLVHSMNGLSFNVQDLISSSNPLISSSNYTNPNTNSSSPTTISSFLASTLQMKGASSHFQTLLPSYEDDLHMKASDVKLELEGKNSTWSGATQNQIEDLTMGSSSSDPSVLWGGGGPNSFGAWLDPSNNIGSSVPSLI